MPSYRNPSVPQGAGPAGHPQPAAPDGHKTPAAGSPPGHAGSKGMEGMRATSELLGSPTQLQPMSSTLHFAGGGHAWEPPDLCSPHGALHMAVAATTHEQAVSQCGRMHGL